MQHTIYALIEWLRAQLDADERMALFVTPGPWRYDPTKVNAISREESVFAGATGQAAITVASTGPSDDPQSMADARFIAAWDPDRVLAEVKAKRDVLDEVEQESRNADDRLRFGGHPGYAGAILWRCVSHLAQPYADRPGWQDEWTTGG